MCGGNYQDNVTMPLSREHDYNATANDGINKVAADLNGDANANATSGVLPAIERVYITQSLYGLNWN